MSARVPWEHTWLVVRRDGVLQRVSGSLAARVPALQVGAPLPETFAPEGGASLEDAIDALWRGQALDRIGRLGGAEGFGARLLGEPCGAADTEVCLLVRDLDAEQAFTARMLQSQQREVLGAVAEGIAHDFNNVLVAVLGNAQLVQHQVGVPSEVQDPLSDIITAAQRGTELCRQLLSYAEANGDAPLRTNVSVVIRDMSRLLGVAAAGRASIRFDLADPGPMVSARAADLRQLVMNLVANAVESFRPTERGLISVVTGHTRADAAYLEHTVVPGARPGRFAFIEVSDTGRGMASDVLREIFSPFFTTRPGARGLGLAAVARIVRSAGGTLRVYSEPGRGTTIRVLWPLLDEAALEQADAPRSEVLRGTILVVDDEPAVRSTASRILRWAGWQVIEVGNGDDALLTARSRPDLDLVLLDVTMPGRSGLDVYEQLDEERPSLPVVLMTGLDQDALSRGAGAEGVRPRVALCKPFTMQGLLDVVDSALGL